MPGKAGKPGAIFWNSVCVICLHLNRRSVNKIIPDDLHFSYFLRLIFFINFGDYCKPFIYIPDHIFLNRWISLVGNLIYDDCFNFAVTIGACRFKHYVFPLYFIIRFCSCVGQNHTIQNIIKNLCFFIIFFPFVGTDVRKLRQRNSGRCRRIFANDTR